MPDSNYFLCTYNDNGFNPVTGVSPAGPSFTSGPLVN